MEKDKSKLTLDGKTLSEKEEEATLHEVNRAYEKGDVAETDDIPNSEEKAAWNKGAAS
jgi:hypothetical protein